jgi:RNA 3'-terminal phosphate cyclase (ATP)
MATSADNSKFVTIDGSFGEGGGQILRTSLALSLVTGRPVSISHIRANREKPGLRPAHLTAVRAAAEVGRAEVEGAAQGSNWLIFRPGRVEAGEYDFRIGTAGSTTLVFQTVLPALLCAGSESALAFEGGTHNAMAPPYDFLARAYLPQVSRLGPKIEALLERPGFYPAGGGRFHVTVRPQGSLGRLDLVARGELLSRRVRIYLSRLPRHIAEREQNTIALETGWDEECFEIDHCSGTPGPGNAVIIELEYEHVTEVCCGFGRLGVRAEEVALEALRVAQCYEASAVPVGEHLADQLLLPLALGVRQGTEGGTFLTGPLSRHSTTHIEVIQKFLDVRIEVEVAGEKECLVRMGR